MQISTHTHTHTHILSLCPPIKWFTITLRIKFKALSMTYKALLYHGPASAYILHPELYKELSKCQAAFKARTFHCPRLHVLCGQRACMLSCVWLSGTPWTVAHQAPLLMAFPGKNTGADRHALLHRVFLTQGLNSHLLHFLHCRWILYHWAIGDALLLF